LDQRKQDRLDFHLDTRNSHKPYFTAAFETDLFASDSRRRFKLLHGAMCGTSTCFPALHSREQVFLNLGG